MNETQRKTDLALGFRLIDEGDTLAQTHWLIFDPPEGYELDDHPPKGPDDRSYLQVFTKRGRDFLTDSRVRGCQHRIIRQDEWPEECRVVITGLITRLWRECEKSSERKAEHKRKKRKLQVLLSVLLVAPAGALMLLKGLSLITLDQFNDAFQSLCYVGAGLLGALFAIAGTEAYFGAD
jgi:hypothetical protein